MAANIALFPSAFAPHVGGVEELTAQLGRQIAATLGPPTIVTMRWPKSLPAQDTVEGLETLRYVFRVPEPKPRYLVGWAARSSATKRQVIRDLAARSTNLVHVQCVAGNARYALHAAKGLGCPLVVSLQGELTMDATQIYQRSAQQRSAWRQLIDSADAVTGCSQFVLDEACDFYPPLREKAELIPIPNGIDVDFFDSARRARMVPGRHILCLGRHVKQKGFDIAIRAFAEISGSVTADLVIAGDGPARPELESLARSLGVADRVKFPGLIARADIAALFAHAVCFVLPSRHEPQGIVVAEAMAAGVPVIAASVGGVPETVRSGTNGLLFQAESSSDLATKLALLLIDDAGSELAERLSAQGIRTAESLDWARSIAPRYTNLYRRLGVA